MAKAESKPQVNQATNNTEKAKALAAALAQIEKQFGKGSIMRLGNNDTPPDIDVVSTGSLGLDVALGVGGLPRGRVIEIYGPESSGKTTLTLHVVAEMQKLGGTCAFVDAEHALDSAWILTTCSSLSLTQASKHSKWLMHWCAQARLTSSWSTRSPHSCHAPKSKATWATLYQACKHV